MKRLTILIAVLANGLLLGNFASAQTVATNPVGFNSVTVLANTTASLGVPFDRPAAFVGLSSSRTSSSITVTGAGWTASPGAGSFGPFSSNPYLVRMLSGASKGRDYQIDSNTTDTLTITTGGDLTTQIANGDQFQIFPAHTLADLFGATATGLNTGNVNVADNILIRGASGFLTYFNTGANWVRQGSGANQNNVAVLPQQGFLLAKRAPGDYTFTGLGAVPTTNLKTDFPASSTVHFSNRFPIDTTLVNLGLHTSPAWVSGGNVNTVDQVLIRGASGWLTYFYTGTNWVRQGSGSNQNGTVIPTGTSVLVVRIGATPFTLDQPLPYSLP